MSRHPGRCRRTSPSSRRSTSTSTRCLQSCVIWRPWQQSTEPFALSLQGTGTFRPVSPVVFVVVSGGVEKCAELEARVRAGDMAVDTRFPYHPHVTLAHDVSEAMLDRAAADLADFGARMHVGSMGLYERLDGQWELVREFEFDA